MFNNFRKLPGIRNKNIALFYIFSIIHSCYFAEGNWIFLYLFFLNYSQIGILDSIAFSIWLLLEIPTGAIADIIGRKTIIRISFFFAAVGILMQGFASTSLILFLGNVLFYIGLAFYSGSMEALTYDSLVELKDETEYEKIVAASKSLQSIAYIIAVLIGGFAASVNIRLPFILWGIVHTVAFILSFKLEEPKIDSVKISLKSYLNLNKEGIKQLFKPHLKPYLFFIFIILGIVFWYDWGFLKPALAVNFGFDAIAMGFVFAGEGILIALLIPLLPKIRKLVNDYTLLVIINLGVVLCIFLFGSDIKYYGALPIILIALLGNFAYALISIIINEGTEAHKRATTLSSVATILKIPYVLTAFWSGQIIEAGFLSQFLYASAFVIGLSSLINLVKNIRMVKSRPAHAL